MSSDITGASESSVRRSPPATPRAAAAVLDEEDGDSAFDNPLAGNVDTQATSEAGNQIGDDSYENPLAGMPGLTADGQSTEKAAVELQANTSDFGAFDKLDMSGMLADDDADSSSRATCGSESPATPSKNSTRKLKRKVAGTRLEDPDSSSDSEEEFETMEVELNVVKSCCSCMKRWKGYTVRQACSEIFTSFRHLFDDGNVAAGFASGLHVNLYIIGLAMIVSNKYFNLKGCMELAVVGTVLMQFFYTAFGSYRHYAIANADTLPAAVTVALTQLVVSSLEDKHDIEEEIKLHVFDNVVDDPRYTACYDDERCRSEVHSTVLVTIMVSGVFTGALLLFLGATRLGSLVSFVPFPAQCAFLSACGFKIVRAGMGFMMSIPMLKFEWDTLKNTGTNIMPMVLMTGFILFAEERFHHHKLCGFDVAHWVTPLALGILTALFYGFILLYAFFYKVEGAADIWTGFGEAMKDCRDNKLAPLPEGRNWLMTDQLSGEAFQVYKKFNIEHVVWEAVFNVNQLMYNISLALVTVIAVLLNSSMLEELTNKDMSFDTELKVSGVANIFAGLAGGFIGFSTVPKTMMCYKLGGSYYSGIFSMLWFVFFLLAGQMAVGTIPLPVLGAFVTAIGAELMIEWTWHVRHEVKRSEMVEILVLFIMCCFSFVGGFLIGIFSALAAFAARYSNIPIIKSEVTLSDYQGNNVWNKKQAAVLKRYGDSVVIVRLQGYIFFFSAEKLRMALTNMIATRNEKQDEPVIYLILDFRMVDDIDGTSTKKIKKLLRTLQDLNVGLYLASVGEDIANTFHREHIQPEHYHFDDGTQALFFFESVELAVERASQAVLSSKDMVNLLKRDRNSGKITMKAAAKAVIGYTRLGFKSYVSGEDFDTPAFRNYGIPRTYNEGDMVVKVGDTVNTSMYYITAGSVAIFIITPQGKEHRVERRYRGHLIGELTFYIGFPRSATIRAAEHGTELVEITKEVYETMQQKQPVICDLLAQNVIGKLGAQVVRQSKEIQVLLK